MPNIQDLRKIELQNDIKELKKLILQTQNARVGEYLAQKLSFIKTQLQFIVENQVKPIQKPELSNIPKNEQFISLTKFSWQEVPHSKTVKIMISLQNVKNICQSEDIKAQFQACSFRIKVHNYRQKKYIFGVGKLYSQIVPQKCSFTLSQNYINVRLQKKFDIDWIDVHYKKDIFKQTKQEEKQKNPKQLNQQQKVMDMVKKIYQDGDPQMQKIIKEAFDNAADKKKK